VNSNHFVHFWSSSQVEPDVAWDNLVVSLRRDSSLKVQNLEATPRYIRVEAKSAVPPNGIDDIEIYLPSLEDRTIFYRSNSREVIIAGPQIVVSDGGSHKNRLEKIRRTAGLVEMGSNVESQNYISDFENLNFFEKQKVLSEPSDINFIDNDVPSQISDE